MRSVRLLLPYNGINQQVQRVRFYLLNSAAVTSASPPANPNIHFLYSISSFSEKVKFASECFTEIIVQLSMIVDTYSQKNIVISRISQIFIL